MSDDYEKERQERRQSHNFEHQQEVDDWEWLMGYPQGRRIVFRDILTPAQLEETNFNGNSRDAFHEGRRDLARQILHRAKQNFDDYLLMLKEHHNV